LELGCRDAWKEEEEKFAERGGENGRGTMGLPHWELGGQALRFSTEEKRDVKEENQSGGAKKRFFFKGNTKSSKRKEGRLHGRIGGRKYGVGT